MLKAPLDPMITVAINIVLQSLVVTFVRQTASPPRAGAAGGGPGFGTPTPGKAAPEDAAALLFA